MFGFIACSKSDNTEPSPVLPVPEVKTASIELFVPQSATDGDEVHIKGKNFTGATAVSFGGKAAQSFKVISDSVLFAVVASGSPSGKLAITTPVNTAESGGFSYYTPQLVTLSGISIYGCLMVNSLPPDGIFRDSSKYKEFTVKETISFNIRKINPNDITRIYALSAISGKPHVPWYVYDSTYVILSGAQQENIQSYGGFYLLKFSDTAPANGSVFARVVGNVITIPEQYPYTAQNGYVSISGSGKINEGKISLELFSNDRHGNTKRSSLVSQ